MWERRAQLGAVHFHLPLQVREFVLLVGPHRRIQLEATDDRDHFLSVGHPPRRDVHRHRYQRRRPEIGSAQRRPAFRANRAGKETIRSARCSSGRPQPLFAAGP